VTVDDANCFPHFRACRIVRVFNPSPLEASFYPPRPRQPFFARQCRVVEIEHSRQHFGSRLLYPYVELIPHPLRRSIGGRGWGSLFNVGLLFPFVINKIYELMSQGLTLDILGAFEANR